MRRSAITTAFAGTDTNDFGVDSARHAVDGLDVEFGQSELLKDRGFSDITDCSLFDHVTDHESLDCLVLRHTARAVGAAQELDVASAVLASSVVSSFLGLMASDWITSTHKLLVPQFLPFQ